MFDKVAEHYLFWIATVQDEFTLFLRDISDCFIQINLSKWKKRLILPFSIITRDGPILMSTEACIEKNFQHYLTAMEIMRLDLIDRHPVNLEDCEDGTWLGTFQTRLLSDGALVVAPYTSTSLLQLVDGEFRMSSMLNGRGHKDWTGIDGV